MQHLFPNKKNSAHSPCKTSATASAYASAASVDIKQEACVRFRKLLFVCDWKINALENDPEALAAISIRDLRSLAKTVHDLQHDLLHYTELCQEENKAESEAENIFKTFLFDEAGQQRLPAYPAAVQATTTGRVADTIMSRKLS
jgi:hypothetical protein